MYRLDRESFLSSPLIGFWSLLGFQAGFVNSFGFLACGRYVSHVTGFGTQVGLALGSSRFSLALELIGFPIAFIFGAAANGVLTSARLERGLRPRYDLTAAVLPVVLVAAALAGHAGWLGPFEETPSDVSSFALLFGLAFLCGLQNGCFATMTKGQIRTTHLTGISTDIGTDMARLLCGQLQGLERHMVIRANASRLLTFAGFASGSILSVLATESVGYLALMVPAATALIAAIVVIRIGQAMDKAIFDPALTSRLIDFAPSGVTASAPAPFSAVHTSAQKDLRFHRPHGPEPLAPKGP